MKEYSEHRFRNPEFEEGTPDKNETQPTNIDFLSVGDTITIGRKEHVVERVTMASEYGKKFALIVPENIPIYWLSGHGGRAKGAFVPKENIVLFFENTDEETQVHELTHAVEFFQEKTPGLQALYERAKVTITEDSFEIGASFNFMKNIHEFIADGRTKGVFIGALKKEGLYDDFMKETDYLFQS